MEVIAEAAVLYKNITRLRFVSLDDWTCFRLICKAIETCKLIAKAFETVETELTIHLYVFYDLTSSINLDSLYAYND